MMKFIKIYFYVHDNYMGSGNWIWILQGQQVLLITEPSLFSLFPGYEANGFSPLGEKFKFPPYNTQVFATVTETRLCFCHKQEPGNLKSIDLENYY